MATKIKIAQFGLGPIGVETLKLVSTKPWAEVVGAIDCAPEKAGRDLGDLTQTKRLRGLKVFSSLAELIRHAKPDLIFHTAVSKFRSAYEHLEPIARQGISVVSSCEEMIFPDLQEPKLAMALHRLCKRTGARMVATGVNPGFVMDILPLCLASVCRTIRQIHVLRVVNASTRREPLQRKIGSGLNPREFSRLLKEGKAGHAGLKESLALLAHGLGWKLKTINETGGAVVAERDIRTAFLTVKRGQNCGLRQSAKASINGKLRLSLSLNMYLDAANPRDSIRIVGDPPLNLVLMGGVAGDQATVAALVNTAPRLFLAAPGLRLLTELPLPRPS